ncbi:MAG TPA: DUF5672 family protein [Nitrospirales bacterium]|nr:DUF5672 family protein [Nitrospirales bacterium]
MSIQHTSKNVAVVVPLSMREQLTPDEELSLRHLVHFLGKYDKYLIAPEGLCLDIPGFKMKYFKKRFFGSAIAHTNLMLSHEFYESFLDYKYILNYHLDALVFSDQMLEWCNADYDYIAPPWIPHEDAPYKKDGHFSGKVGNGGFSLRKIESFLKVLNSREYSTDPEFYTAHLTLAKSRFEQLALQGKRLLKYVKKLNDLQWELRRNRQPEDYFWANRAQHYFPEFKIAPVEVALKFAFECVPGYCFELTNHTLPFGCHAWQKYDKDFWKPYLLK